MSHIVRKSGIPVLAYPKCDIASPVPSSLVIRCNEPAAQATLCLQFSLHIRGFGDAQTFILQYDADNLVPGSISLGPATVVLPQTRLDEIARHGNPQIRTLSLTLKNECAVWYPNSHGPLIPRDRCEAPYDQLRDLARAVQVDILFDYNWLHRDTHPLFQRLIHHPAEFSGFPVDRHYRRQLRCADWSVFNRGDEAAAIEDKESPPSYLEASAKRPRNVSRANSPTAASPPAKRVLRSPFPDHVPPSPTEKNTPSPRLPSYAALSSKTLHSSNTAAQSPRFAQPPAIPADVELDRAVEQTLSTLLPSVLPNMLSAILPSLLPTLLATPSDLSSPCPTSPAASQYSSISLASQISQLPPPPGPALTALGISLSEQVTTKVEKQLENIYAHTLSHANHLRHVADAEFEEVREDERLMMKMEKDDAIAELEKVGSKCIEDVKDRVSEVEVEVVERMGWKVEEVLDRLAREAGWLRWEREILRRERAEFEEERREADKGRGCKREKRAGSAPP